MLHIRAKKRYLNIYLKFIGILIEKYNLLKELEMFAEGKKLNEITFDLLAEILIFNGKFIHSHKILFN